MLRLNLSQMIFYFFAVNFKRKMMPILCNLFLQKHFILFKFFFFLYKLRTLNFI